MGSLRRVLKGMDRVCLEEDSSRALAVRVRPLTSHMLIPMLCYLDTLGNKSHEMAALALGKACGLRPDNYLFGTNKRCILISNLHWVPPRHPTRLILNLNIGKTNKVRKIVQYILDCACPPSYTCPVHLVRKIARERLNQSNEPLLRKPNGRIFNVNAMSALLRELCQIFELDKKYYTPYCLRVGAASEEYWNTGDIRVVMLKYHWDSETSCLRYLRESNVDLYNFIPPNIQVPARPLPKLNYSSQPKRQ